MYTCGKGLHGQLGLGALDNQVIPEFVSKIPEPISQIACGEEHTLVLTVGGQVFAMGSNSSGQLGLINHQ